MNIAIVLCSCLVVLVCAGQVSSAQIGLVNLPVVSGDLDVAEDGHGGHYGGHHGSGEYYGGGHHGGHYGGGHHGGHYGGGHYGGHYEHHHHHGGHW